MLPFQFRSYLSKYLILHMLNYYPIQRENQIFRGAGTGLTGPKSGHSGATFGDLWPSNELVTGRTLDY